MASDRTWFKEAPYRHPTDAHGASLRFLSGVVRRVKRHKAVPEALRGLSKRRFGLREHDDSSGGAMG